MKKMITMMMVAVLALSMLAGCGSTKTTGSVATDGSTSMEKVIGALGEAFQNETGINFTYNPTGSGSGIKAVLEGRLSFPSAPPPCYLFFVLIWYLHKD